MKPRWLYNVFNTYGDWYTAIIEGTQHEVAKYCASKAREMRDENRDEFSAGDCSLKDWKMTDGYMEGAVMFHEFTVYIVAQPIEECEVRQIGADT